MPFGASVEITRKERFVPEEAEEFTEEDWSLAIMYAYDAVNHHLIHRVADKLGVPKGEGRMAALEKAWYKGVENHVTSEKKKYFQVRFFVDAGQPHREEWNLLDGYTGKIPTGKDGKQHHMFTGAGFFTGRKGGREGPRYVELWQRDLHVERLRGGLCEAETAIPLDAMFLVFSALEKKGRGYFEIVFTEAMRKDD